MIFSEPKNDEIDSRKPYINDGSSLKIQSSCRFEYSEPRFIESKITYGSASTRLKSYEKGRIESKKYAEDAFMNNMPEL